MDSIREELNQVIGELQHLRQKAQFTGQEVEAGVEDSLSPIAVVGASSGAGLRVAVPVVGFAVGGGSASSATSTPSIRDHHDVGHYPPCVVLEQADGSLHGALHDSLSSFNRSLLNKVRVMLGVAKAVAVICEQRKIVLHELTPTMILLVDGVPQLGGCVATSAASSTSRGDGSVNVTAYTAPELLNSVKYGQQHVDMVKAVVYSFGVILNEVLTEKIPFQGCDESKIRKSIKARERPDVFRPSSLIDTVGVALKNVVQACWLTDAPARPAFSTLADDLATILTVLIDVQLHGYRASLIPKPIQLRSSRSSVAVSSMKRSSVVTTPVSDSSAAGAPSNNTVTVSSRKRQRTQEPLFSAACYSSSSSVSSASSSSSSSSSSNREEQAQRQERRYFLPSSDFLVGHRDDNSNQEYTLLAPRSPDITQYLDYEEFNDDNIKGPNLSTIEGISDALRHLLGGIS